MAALARLNGVGLVGSPRPPSQAVQAAAVAAALSAAAAVSFFAHVELLITCSWHSMNIMMAFWHEDLLMANANVEMSFSPSDRAERHAAR